MAQFTVTYRTETSRPPEQVEADTVAVEAGGQVVLRRSVVVIGQPREVVVLRLAGRDLLSVEPTAELRHRHMRPGEHRRKRVSRTAHASDARGSRSAVPSAPVPGDEAALELHRGLAESVDARGEI